MDEIYYVISLVKCDIFISDTYCFRDDAFSIMSLVRTSMVPGCVGCVLLAAGGRGRGNGRVVEGVVLGIGVAPDAGVAGGSMPACLNMFMSAIGSAGADTGF